MEDVLKDQLAADETIIESRGVHGAVLILPVAVTVVGLLQFTRWSFAPGAALAGWVAVAYGVFTGWLFWLTFRHGRLALTSRRLIYVQKTPFRAPDLSAWEPGGFDAVMVRKGVFGSLLGYGHLLLLKSGRLVAVVRSVRDLQSLVPRIETELLKRGAVTVA